MDRLDQAIALLDRRVDIGVVAEAVGLSEDQIKAGMALRGVPVPRAAGAEGSAVPTAERCLEIMFEVAQYGRHEGTRVKAAKFVRDDLLGREDKVQGNAAEQDAFLARLTERASKVQAARDNFFKRPIDV